MVVTTALKTASASSVAAAATVSVLVVASLVSRWSVACSGTVDIAGPPG